MNKTLYFSLATYRIIGSQFKNYTYAVDIGEYPPPRVTWELKAYTQTVSLVKFPIICMSFFCKRLQ